VKMREYRVSAVRPFATWSKAESNLVAHGDGLACTIPTAYDFSEGITGFTRLFISSIPSQLFL
jgi:hypothetical protein